MTIEAKTADEYLAEAIFNVDGGFDRTKMAQTIQGSQDLLLQFLRETKGKEFKSTKRVACPECHKYFQVEIQNIGELAKSIAHVTKHVDLYLRLGNFMQGKPDSRVQMMGSGGGQDWLALLSNEQFLTVRGWAEANRGQMAAMATTSTLPVFHSRDDLHQGEAEEEEEPEEGREPVNVQDVFNQL